MKNTIKKTVIKLLLIIVLIAGSQALMSQPPPPPSDHGLSSNQNAGNGAPIGSGVGILLALGAAYGGKKVWDMRKKPAG